MKKVFCLISVLLILASSVAFASGSGEVYRILSGTGPGTLMIFLLFSLLVMVQ